MKLKIYIEKVLTLKDTENFILNTVEHYDRPFCCSKTYCFSFYLYAFTYYLLFEAV